MIESEFFGKTLTKRPSCPFCGMVIEKPKELDIRRPGEMPVGSCSCGAVYACDETGHNVGSAIVEALVFGCNMDWDLAWSLLPEEDYQQKIVEDYDYISHYIVPGRALGGRRISGVLLFIRFHADVLEVSSEGVHKRLKKKAESEVPPSEQAVEQAGKGSLSKKEVEGLVKEFHFEPILNVSGQDHRLIRNLQRLLYSGDDLFRKRAAEILGRACAVIGGKDPGAVSKLLGTLFYAIRDTAAFTWGAFEAIGEIISHKSEFFAGYIPQLYQYLYDESRRVHVLQAIGRIAKSRPDLIRKFTSYFIPFLADSDPRVRGYAAWLLGNLGACEARRDLEKLRGDSYTIEIYENGNLGEKTVGEVASEALERL